MAAIQSLSVTVVEDNPNMRLMLCQVLRVIGVSTLVEACNGHEAIDALRQSRPDVLITDCNMAPVDGLELTRWVRTSGDSPDSYMPILMVSSLSDPRVHQRALDVGISHFLPKPFQPRELIEALFQVIRQPRPFVRTDSYFGPDRRQGERDEMMFDGPDRRLFGSDTEVIQ
ncbi:response regulator [Insolitispirillum peregrinum]|uniref:response regulator n=1 Tax=Insolitispirillum peregrinum TaxID=80876 RepID=UPI0036085F9A